MLDDFYDNSSAADKCGKCGCQRADHDWIENSGGKLACPQSKSDKKRGKPRDITRLFEAGYVAVPHDSFRF